MSKLTIEDVDREICIIDFKRFFPPEEAYSLFSSVSKNVNTKSYPEESVCYIDGAFVTSKISRMVHFKLSDALTLAQDRLARTGLDPKISASVWLKIIAFIRWDVTETVKSLKVT